ncbi:MAG TPA: hypothetical protein VNA25_20760 [Phycisphaerae bacterium]|nr:hypothetical protein [Phycisphaerae bacterium]
MPRRQVELGVVRGVNIASWTAGELPVATSWMPQTYRNSQAITGAMIEANSDSFRRRGCLRLDVDLVGRSDNKRLGEMFVDLRYPPIYEAARRFQAPVNLEGKLIYCMVFCPRGSGGSPDAPSGLQLFAKSISPENGKETWHNFYGNWHNIWTVRPLWHRDPRLGDVLEGTWSLIVAAPGREKPPFGIRDDDFDPTQVVALGLKIGLNDKYGGDYHGTLLVDQFGWGTPGPNPLSTGAIGVHSQADYATFFKDFCQPECTFDFETTSTPVAELRQHNYTCLSIVVTQYMDGRESNAIGPDPAKTNSDAEVEALITAAQREGLQVFLKPHVDVADGTWRGNIAPKDRTAWFSSYTTFITHYARLAEKHRLPLLAVGTEFRSLQGPNYREQWAQVIREVRKVFGGRLTYCANWDDYQDVSFWQEVDLLGIDAYFPISDERDPTLEQLVQGWSQFRHHGQMRNWKQELADFHAKVGRPILFTELGYRSIDCAASRPWDYREDRPINEALQERCFQAVVKALGQEKWFQGFLIWLWSPRMDVGGPLDTGFTTQHKQALSLFEGPSDLQ